MFVLIPTHLQNGCPIIQSMRKGAPEKTEQAKIKTPDLFIFPQPRR